MIRLLSLFLLSVLLFASCQKSTNDSLEPDPAQMRAEFSNMLVEYYDGKMALDPVSATSGGDARFNASFPNFLSDAYKDSSIAFYRSFKNLAESFKDQNLSNEDELSRAILLWDCNIQLEELSFRKELLPIDQMWSINLIVAQYAMGRSAQPFKTVEDYDNWLQRLDGFAQWLSTAERRMKEGVSIRYVLPSSLIIKVIPQLKSMTDGTAESNLFYAPVRQFPDSFSSEERERLQENYTKMISEKLIPALRSLYDYVSTDYLKAGRTSSGIDAIPTGKEYYDFSIKKYTTTTLSAEEIHQIGLDEVARITDEMNIIKEKVGFEGSLLSFFDSIRTDKKLMPFKTAEQVIEHFNKIHHTIEPHLNQLFLEAPKTKFIVKRIEKFREASTGAHYNRGSLKDDRPGIFYVSVPDAEHYNIFTDESLFLHEAIPGHHYQLALTQENDSLPKFRKGLWYSAYGEGWALYAESLGKQLGLFTDPYQYFGMLTEEMHRSIRLVVDTGLHSKGWTREQAIQYSMENEAYSLDIITMEIERYMANPGQALSYKIGQLKILSLRNRAEQILGPAFDIKEFHHEVLQYGCVPLVLLEQQVNKWIDDQKALM